MRVSLAQDEIWPALVIDSEGTPGFEDSEAIEVPDALIRAIFDARAAANVAEVELEKWLRKNHPKHWWLQP